MTEPNSIHIMPPVPEGAERDPSILLGKDVSKAITRHHWATASAVYVANMDVFREAAEVTPRLAKKLASLN